MSKTRWATGLLGCLVLLAPTPSRADEEPTSTSEVEIARWTDDLDAPTFASRREAQEHLLEAGDAAVDSLVEAAKSKSLETATTAIELLYRLASSEDLRTQEKATIALEHLVESKEATALETAVTTLAAHRRVSQELAIEQLRNLGGHVNTSMTPWGAYSSITVILDENWEGGTEGLIYLKRIPDLSSLVLKGDSFQDDVLEPLGTLKNAKAISIFGTKITDGAVERLAAALPDAQVTLKRGALLGVGGPIAAGTGCSISTVIENSAAAKADLRVGDIVQSVDGEKVTDFSELSALIGKKRAGEKISIEVFRNEKLITKEVVLGDFGDYGFPQ